MGLVFDCNWEHWGALERWAAELKTCAEAAPKMSGRDTIGSWGFRQAQGLCEGA